MNEANSSLPAIGALLRAGRVADAYAATKRALAAGEDDDGLLAMSGLLALQSGDPSSAIAPLRTLLARRPNDRATRLNLASALTETAAFDGIEPLLAPLAGDVAADRLRAFAAQQRGENDRAIALYRAVLRSQSSDADSWNNLGNVLAAAGAVDEAISAFEHAITARPADVRIYLNLAGVLERADRRAARRRVMRDAAALAPRDPDVLLSLGLAEAADQNVAAATAALERAISLAPDAPGAYLELALLLENNNAVTELEALARQAEARIGPEGALLTAWSDYRAGRFDAAAAAAATIPDTINPVRRLHLQAQIADRRDDAATAFALFEQMNAAAVSGSPPPAIGSTYREQITAATAAFGAAAVMAADCDPAGQTPIFIAGFPRSGTTLLDTMLGALPDTHVLEERPLMAAVEQSVTDRGSTSEASAADLRARYFEALRTFEPDYVKGRLIDKHPLHTARVPVIHRSFPGAPLILVERHPYDVVLSCFMANFQLNHAMRSFTTLEEAARTYDAVFAAWTMAEERLPLRVHRVRYERLIDDVPGELGALLAFLGIDADPAALDHQAAARARGPVRTASYSQVTEPIYRRAIARWRRYTEQLRPVMPILAPWAERMGYDTA